MPTATPMPPRGCAERRDQHEQRHHGEVLEQQHADHLRGRAPNRARRARRAASTRSRSTTSPRCRRAPRPPASRRRARAPRRRAAASVASDLRAAQAEHHAPHREQLRQAEFEPDREHQEHHAELGEVPCLLAIGRRCRARAGRARARWRDSRRCAGSRRRAAKRDRDHGCSRAARARIARETAASRHESLGYTRGL